MYFFGHTSIQRKLTFVIVCTSVLGLSLACMAFEIYEKASFRRSMVEALTADADTLGLAAAASLEFNDRKAAEEMLSAIRVESYVVSATLYDKNGVPFTEYRRAGLGAKYKSPVWEKEGAQFDPDALTVYQKVALNGESVGFIAIVSDLSQLRLKIRQYTEISALVLVVSVFATFLVSSRLLRLIVEPILQLAGVAGRVSEREDYTLRATPRGHDEVGALITAFNQMLEKIQERDSALQKAKDELEIRVQERTKELQEEVSERKQAEAEMRNARDVAEKASKAKSEFLANMSHEIRTPLNGVMGMTDLALDTHLSAEQREYVETVKNSADSLLTVINDILDFSKIEAGKIDLEDTDFNLRDSLESTLKTMALRADEKGLELLCEVAAEIPEMVRGDFGRLRQVVVNLVGNGLKFTERGEVGLKVQLDNDSGEEQIFHFTVADTGIGIPANKRELIFNPFSQADTSTTRKYGGTGLGLTISARLVRMMGGRIWVESEVGRGAQFHFTVCMKKSNAKPVEVAAIASADILRGVRVLVVDDNRTNQKILEGMLRRWEMRSTLVEGGAEALQQLTLASASGDPYGLVLTDMHMPRMDGFALIEEIRQRPELSAATIMMLTSAGHRGDAERCNELGVSAYLLKPVRQVELREAVARVLGTREKKAATPLITRFSLRDALEPAGFLNILLAEDNPVNQRLATRLLEKRGHRVSLAANGREALEALEKGTFDLVLMDVQMPEMDGLEATAAIREKEKEGSAHVPVIALTAHAMKGDREKCLASGMDGYLTKPIRQPELDEVLRSYLTLRTMPVRMQEPATQNN
ncbi:MAG TPA: response regulator [Candidatus Acidoferrum sp.]|jgi:signal transduction histidine kinase/CheY-like chemotaxis protein